MSDKPFDLSPFDLVLPEPDPNMKEKMLERCRTAPTAYENWAPAVEKAGVRAPDTMTVPLTFELQEAFLEGYDLSTEAIENIDAIVNVVEEMGAKHGFPLFIKTSYTSHKHDWSRSCCLASADRTVIIQQLANIVEYQGFSPYPMSPSLLIRQMLETSPAFHAFGGMPITQEFRFFGGKGKVQGYQPYWPEDYIKEPSIQDWKAKLSVISRLSTLERKKLMLATECVTDHLEGDWSVDFLKDRHGKWWLIDMAEAGLSYKNEKDFVQFSDHPSHDDEPTMG